MPINREAFEQKARRILVAFGLDAEAPLQIKEKSYTDFPGARREDLPFTFFEGESDGEWFLLNIYQWTERTKDGLFCIGIKEASQPHRGRWCIDFTQDLSNHSLTETKTDQTLKTPRWWKCHPRYISLMLRGLSHLDYDIEPLAEQIGLELTTHEKLEWALQRREAQRANQPPDARGQP